MQRPNVDDDLTLLTDFGKTEAIVVEVIDNPATEEGVLVKVMTRGPFSEQTALARDDAGADPVAFLARMIQFSADAHAAGEGSAPAADRSVVLVVADMAAFGVQDDPAQFGIRQVGAALPGIAGPMREWREFHDPAPVGIEPAVTVSPHVAVRFVWFGLGLEESVRKLKFVGLRSPLESQLIQFADPGVGVGEFLDLRTIHQTTGLVHDKWTVHQKEGLLRHGGAEPLRARRVRAGKIEGAKDPRKILAFDEAIDGAPTGERFGGDVDAAPAGGEVDAVRYG